MSSEQGPSADYAEKVVEFRQDLLSEQQVLIEAWDRLNAVFRGILHSRVEYEADSPTARLMGIAEETIVDLANAAAGVGDAARGLGEATKAFVEVTEDQARNLQCLVDEIEPVPRF